MSENLKDFTEALRLAARALEEARPHIDALHGRLEELQNYQAHVDQMADTAQDIVDEAEAMYQALPVWSDISDMAMELEGLALAIEDGTAYDEDEEDDEDENED